MQKGIVKVNGVPTYVATWGAWIEDDLKNHQNLIVCISGNPGVTSFYNEFLETLYGTLDMPVWILSHAGHEVGQDVTIPPLSGNRELYNLEGQIKHKIEFLKKYVPPHVNIYFIGHSIGSYMILRVLKQFPEIKGRVIKAYMLFPTIQKMRDSPNGKFFSGVIQYIVPIIVFLSWIFTLLPLVVRKTLLYGYFTIQSTKKDMIRPTMKLINPRALRNVFFLAKEEMDVVTELDPDLINNVVDKLFFYFSTSDGWVPLSYYEDLKKSHPRIHALTTNHRHAFVLDSGREVGYCVSKWIKSESSGLKPNTLQS
ncbi:Lipid droplet-associated hydrolase [Gryllus bimaculatus]|nr:Lipid droplet-associated hydrolase [Gryllus bimaculatus]